MNHIQRKTYFILTAVFFLLARGVNAGDKALNILTAGHLFTIESDFTQPSDVAVGKNGEIYVMDGVNNKVKVFDIRGKYLFSIGKTGRNNGEFNFPLGLGLDETGKIYVADSGNHRVQIFSPEGAYISQFKTGNTHSGKKPSDPTDVAVNSKLKRCYVVDNDNHCILVYDIEKKSLLKTVGTMGMEKKEFRFPFFLDIDSHGNVYIVEVINTRVKVLDPDGNYLTNIGGWGVEKGEFYRPKGVAVYSDNRVFVSDSYLGVIQVFDTDGRFLSVIGDDNGNILKFVTPTGLCIDSQKRLYVVEMSANRVSVLSLK